MAGQVPVPIESAYSMGDDLQRVKLNAVWNL
jgi:hypothetical protein